MNPNQEPQILLPLRLAQALVDYLKTRPYLEVASLIDGLVKAPRAQLAEEPKANEKLRPVPSAPPKEVASP